jgi:hypothetical protein
MNRPSKKEVAIVIKQLIKLGSSKESIAAQVRVSGVSVTNWLTGKSAPNWPTYDAMLVMLHKTKKGKK